MFFKEYRDLPEKKIFTGYSSNPDAITHSVPYAFFVEESIIVNKNSSLQSTFKFRGHDLDSCTPFELNSITERLNNCLKRISEDWTFHVEARRFRSKEYIKKENINEFPVLIIDQEREDFFKSGNHFESEYFFTFTYFVPPDYQKKLDSFFFTSDDEKEVINSFKDSLKYYKDELSNIYGLLSELFKSCKLLTSQEQISYYHSCVSDDDYFLIDIPKAYNCLIDNYICNCKLIGGTEPILGYKYFRVVSIRNFPNESYEGILDRLNRLAIEYRWVSRYIPLDKVSALSELEKRRKKWFSKRMSIFQLATETFTNRETRNVNRDALNKEEQIKEEITFIEEDSAIEGYYTISIILMDENQESLDKKCFSVKKTLNSIGFVAEIEDTNNLDAWYGAIPGNVAQNIRKPFINSYNLAHLLPTSAIWSGNELCKHLNEPPLIYTQTSGNTPFRLDIFYGDVGHTMIIGPNGSGKSVLLAFMVAHFLRYTNSQIISFDKGGSSRVLCYACGGEFYDLGEDECLPLQPLAHCDDPTDREWCISWIEDIIERENIILTPEIKNLIAETLRNLGNTAPNRRTMSNFTSLLSGQNKKLGAAMEQFCKSKNGPLARYFDGEIESIGNARFIVFEMGKISRNEKALEPALDYIFHISEKKLDGRPTLFPYDEAWAFVKNKKAAEKMNEQLKTFRKLNAAVIFASQSLADAINSPLFPALLDNCFTRIYLPNPTAMEDIQAKTYQTFGLNQTEIATISQMTPKKQYYFKNPDGSRPFELSLSGLELAYVGTAAIEEQNVAIDLKQKYPSIDDFNVHWLNHRGFNGKNVIELAKKMKIEGEKK